MTKLGTKKFILSSNAVNSYGFRLKTEGADLERFKSNPIMLYNHKQGRWSDVLPIGRWLNVRVENGNLVAESDFDLSDEFAKKIAQKVEDGYLKAASVGFDPIEVSDDPEEMEKGQTMSTVTKWSPFEASVVDIPSNEEALALRKDNGEIELLTKASDFGFLSHSNSSKTSITKNETKMKKYPVELLKLLGLGEDATDIQVLTAVQELNKDKEKLTTDLSKAQEELEEARSAEAVELVNEKATELGFSEEEKGSLLKLAKSDPETCKKTLSLMKKRETLSGLAGSAGSAGAGDAGKAGETKEKTFNELSKENPAALLAMKQNEPEKYNELLQKQKEENRLKYGLK